MTHQFLTTWFWPLITSVAVIAALINFSVAFSQRKYTQVVMVRAGAGLAAVALALFIVIGKQLGFHPDLNLTWQSVFAGAGAFVFLVLWLPSRVESSSEAPQRPTMQERAARPVRATVRLQQTIPEDWMN